MERFIRLPEVQKITGFGKTTIYEMVNSGEFPRQVKLRKDGRAVGWKESDIKIWVDSK